MPAVRLIRPRRHRPTRFRGAARRAREIGRPAAAALAVLASGYLGQPAHAARPLITDDARIVDAQACQLESWMQFQSGQDRLWALPACNPTGNLELTLGGAAHRQAGDIDATDIQLQAKTVLKPLDTGQYGVALAVGAIHHVDGEPRRALGNVYINVPLTLALLNDRVFTHVNVGATRDTEARTNRLTWGLGTESQLHPRVFLIAETFGQNRGNPSFQAGLRFWIVKDRVQVDTTYGNSFGGDTKSRFFTIGLRLLSPPFLR